VCEVLQPVPSAATPGRLGDAPPPDDGVLEVSLDGEPLRTPVVEGANTVYVRVGGGGDSLRLRSVTPGVAICLDSWVVGNVVPTR
jgi:hypothetical protein